MDKFTLDDSMRHRRWREEGDAPCWALARKLVLGLALALSCQCALAQAMYRIKPLGILPGGCTSGSYGTPGATGFNAADQVAGDACNANGDEHAFLWKNDGTPMVDLGPAEVGSYSQATGLNASGLVGGYANDSTGDFIFVSSGDGTPMKRIYDGLGGSQIVSYAMNDLGQLTGGANTTGDSAFHANLWKNDGSPMLDLGSLGGDLSYGNAINASGQVTGASNLPGNKTRHTFVWKNDGTPMQDLGGGTDSAGSYINASGQVAGWNTVPNGANHVFFWRNDGTPIQDLGTLNGAVNSSYPYALNDAGQIAGASYTNGINTPHSFVWMNDGTPMKDLGNLSGTSSYATDINASGQVTGLAYLAGDVDSHAFLWRNDGTKMQDLNKLIDPTDPLKPYVTLIGGDFINDHGDIVADGNDSRTGLQGLYLLQSAGVTTSVLTLAPRALAFGNVPVNSSSATQPVTVTNTSTNAVAITSIALRGTAPKQFAFTDDCGKSLAGHATCTLKAQFTPSLKGAKTAYLDVNGGGGGLRSVKLTGTGT